LPSNCVAVRFIRMVAATFHEILLIAAFKTGDQTLDGMLEDARHKFLNRDSKVRREFGKAVG
jgi:hypothetical protein